MTWQELADFINNDMPECNRNQQVTVWDDSIKYPTGGRFYDVNNISPYDECEEPNENNIYSININVEDVDNWWC